MSRVPPSDLTAGNRFAVAAAHRDAEVKRMARAGLDRGKMLSWLRRQPSLCDAHGEPLELAEEALMLLAHRLGRGSVRAVAVVACREAWLETGDPNMAWRAGATATAESKEAA